MRAFDSPVEGSACPVTRPHCPHFISLSKSFPAIISSKPIGKGAFARARKFCIARQLGANPVGLLCHGLSCALAPDSSPGGRGYISDTAIPRFRRCVPLGSSLGGASHGSGAAVDGRRSPALSSSTVPPFNHREPKAPATGCISPWT